MSLICESSDERLLTGFFFCGYYHENDKYHNHLFSPDSIPTSFRLAKCCQQHDLEQVHFKDRLTHRLHFFRDTIPTND